MVKFLSPVENVIWYSGQTQIIEWYFDTYIDPDYHIQISFIDSLNKETIIADNFSVVANSMNWTIPMLSADGLSGKIYIKCIENPEQFGYSDVITVNSGIGITLKAVNADDIHTTLFTELNATPDLRNVSTGVKQVSLYYKSNDVVSFSVKDITKYQFTGWYDELGNLIKGIKTLDNVSITSSKVYFAKFQNMYSSLTVYGDKFNVDVTVNGEILRTPIAKEYPLFAGKATLNISVPETIQGVDGFTYSFYEWELYNPTDSTFNPVSPSSSIIVTITGLEPKIIKPVYRKNVQLLYVLSDDGISLPVSIFPADKQNLSRGNTDFIREYSTPQRVTLTALPISGYKFVKWIISNGNDYRDYSFERKTTVMVDNIVSMKPIYVKGNE